MKAHLDPEEKDNMEKSAVHHDRPLNVPNDDSKGRSHKRQRRGEVSSSESSCSAVSCLSNEGILCPLMGFLTTHELGRLLLLTHKGLTETLSENDKNGGRCIGIWKILCESRWNSNNVMVLKEATSLTEKQIFQCFAYDSYPAAVLDSEPQELYSHLKPTSSRLPLDPACTNQPPEELQPLPALQYEPDDYAMVVDVRHDDNAGEKLIFHKVIPGKDIPGFFKDGELPFIDVPQGPALLTSIEDDFESRLYCSPNNLPPLEIKLHLWRRPLDNHGSGQYLKLLHLTNYVAEHMDWWSINKEDDIHIAETCGSEPTYNALRSFPPPTDRLEQLLHRLDYPNDEIKMWATFLFNVHYPAAHDDDLTCRLAKVTITEFTLTGVSVNQNIYLDQIFGEQESEVEFAHLLEAFDDWKDVMD